MKIDEHGLGRIVQFDPKSKLFAARSISPMPQLTEGIKYWWDNGWWGDQGSTSQCVGYASAPYLEDAPITHPAPGPFTDPQVIYDGAQRMDGQALPHAGTSGLAACQWMLYKELITSYYWCFSLDDIINALLTVGPVLLGIPWYRSMDEERTSGLLRVDTNSGLRGYHEIEANGVNTTLKQIRIKNSWGQEWMNNGRARFTFEGFEKLWATGASDAKVPIGG